MAIPKIGTAGWSVPKEHTSDFSTEGSHLVRYSSVLNCVEINSSFYREHQKKTYERWAMDTPKSFKFSVKLSKTFSHIEKMKVGKKAVRESLDAISGLGNKFSVLLIQLPPSLEFNAKIAKSFFETLRACYSEKMVIEPRHLSWASEDAIQALKDFSISKVFADPERVPIPEEMQPVYSAGGIVYFRLHGRPLIYKSAYSMQDLEKVKKKILLHQKRGVEAWCIFDNTTFGHATRNAIDFLTFPWR